MSACLVKSNSIAFSINHQSHVNKIADKLPDFSDCNLKIISKNIFHWKGKKSIGWGKGDTIDIVYF